jgi:hypothetical protein
VCFEESGKKTNAINTPYRQYLRYVPIKTEHAVVRCDARANLKPPQTHLPECRMCTSWFCASQIRSVQCRCRFPSPFLGTSPVSGPQVPSHPQPTRTHTHTHTLRSTPVLRLPFFSPTAFGVISNPRQSSADPPPRRHPRGFIHGHSYTPNRESRLRLGVSDIPSCNARDHRRNGRCLTPSFCACC